MVKINVDGMAIESFCAGKTTFQMILCGRRSGKMLAMGVALQKLKSQAWRELGGMGDKHLRRGV